MEKVNLGYSTKNIPLPAKNEYLKRFIEKTEHFIRRLRWKAHYFLNGTESTAKESYGFKSRNSPPQISELQPFEEDMTRLIQNIKFKDIKSNFQSKLNSDIKNKIKKPNSLLIPADKTTNFYAMNPSSYDKLVKENVTKTYKKSNGKLVEKLDAKSAKIAERLKLDDRIEKLATNAEAFVTLKDHKPNFYDHPTCRLINPSKSEIGAISKQILDDINASIITSTKINQWKNTASVLKWFKNLKSKSSLSFICFDVCEFYPSITEKLLSEALNFASQYRQITSQEREIILHAKRSLLFSDSCPWEKKSANNQFDVTMGSFDGAETCELVGCYLLSLLTKKYGHNIGLYRDDGLAAFNMKPREIERIKKGICKVFRDHDLKITVEANTTRVNFLDVTLDLRSEKFYPYMKEGNIPLYVHKESNHPPSILRNIPESINKRLSEISSDKECFDSAKGVYQEALDRSGYQHKLSFTPSQPFHPRNARRQRNILWFNPPFSKNVATNVGKCFLSLIDKHFPKSNPLNKIFNRNTIKLSYSCMGNVRTIISNHNKAEINKSVRTNDQKKNCNCRKPNSCPMDGNCNAENVIYQAEVTTPTTKETYIGLCDTTFKLRFRNHLCSFRNERYKHATALSKYIWSLKDQQIAYEIKWRQVKQARSYSNVSKRCNLCLWEKFFILCRPEMSTLNSRNELASGCRHARKFLLNSVLF